MILSKEIKIPISKNLSSDYFESVFKSKNLNVIKWSISGISDNNYILTVSIIGKNFEN